MKKITFLLCLICSLILTSCETYAQIPIETGYEYYWNNHRVVYINQVPHYHFWIRGKFETRPVPTEHWRYIHRVEHPMFGRNPQKPHTSSTKHFRSSTRLTGHQHDFRPLEGRNQGGYQGKNDRYGRR